MLIYLAYNFSPIEYPAANYMFKVNNRSSRTRCEICSKLSINTPVCLFNFEHISLVFLLLTLSSEITARRITLGKRCPYSELFWSVFSHSQTEYREMRSIFQHLPLSHLWYSLCNLLCSSLLTFMGLYGVILVFYEDFLWKQPSRNLLEKIIVHKFFECSKLFAKLFS